MSAPSSTSSSFDVRRIAVLLLLAGYALVAVGPLLFMLLNSFRPSNEIFNDPLGLPTELYFGNYVEAWTEARFATYFSNSVLVVVSGVVLCVVVSAMAAYPLSRYDFRGNGVLTAYFIAGLTLPIELAVVPIFYLLGSFGMVDSRLGLVLVYAATGIPFSVFILAAFFRGLPRDLEEAARLDGAGEFRIFARVMLPLVKPAIATVSIFQFVQLWNDFFFPLVLLRTTEKYTLPVGPHELLRGVPDRLGRRLRRPHHHHRPPRHPLPLPHPPDRERPDRWHGQVAGLAHRTRRAPPGAGCEHR